MPGKEGIMGCLYRRGGVYWIKYYRKGKPFNESCHTKKKEVAKRLLKQREGEISKGEIPGIYFDKMGFGELAEDLKTDYRINGRKSLWRIGIAVKHLSDYFGSMKATMITTAEIKRYVEKRLET